MKRIIILFFILLLTILPVASKSLNTEAILQYNRGIDYYKIGRYDESIVAFRQAIRLDPDYIDAYYNLGSVLEYLRQYDAALSVFKQIIVRKPNDYESIYKAAWLSCKLGYPEKAKTYLSIIPADCPIAKEAQQLAEELNFSLNQETQETENVEKPKFVSKTRQTNLIYQDIPAPTGISSDKDGNIYVAEFNTNSIIKITPKHKKIVYLKDSQIDGPIGLAIDALGNLYIANYNKDNVLKVSQYGEISVLIKNVEKPYYLHIFDNTLFVSCQGSDSVLRYNLP